LIEHLGLVPFDFVAVTKLVSMEPQPRVIIIAGPNGAGKTTFAREFLPQEAECMVFVNADLIAEGIAPRVHTWTVHDNSGARPIFVRCSDT
jgi:chloramphenicol 3-O-phosphotransferase